MTTKTSRVLSALCAVLYMAFAPVWADEGTAQSTTFELGLSTWISSGETSWSHDASAINSNLGGRIVAWKTGA